MNLPNCSSVGFKPWSLIVTVCLACILSTISPWGTAKSNEGVLADPFAIYEGSSHFHVARIDRNSGNRQVIQAHKRINTVNARVSSSTSSEISGKSSRSLSNQPDKDRNTEYQLHYVTKYDTRDSLAVKYLGEPGEWLLIALHNQLDPVKNPAAGTVLRIPVRKDTSDSLKRKIQNSASLSLPTSTATDFFGEKRSGNGLSPDSFSNDLSSSPDNASQAYLFAARVNTEHLIGGSELETHTSDFARNESRFGEPAVISQKIDMFAGEARVFGKVDVSRVAVGNGEILRAEVLANGDLLTIAQAAGSSSLHLWHKDNSRSDLNIRVSAEDPEYRVKLEKSVRMRVKMIEFRRSALQRLGIDWGDSIEGPVFATAGDFASNSLFRPTSSSLGDNLPLGIDPFATSFGLATQLTSRINFLVTNGDAEMLAEPVLSCINGGTAKFLAGGEVPYPTVGANGQTSIEFREYGIRLEVSPVADDNGNIQASILTEVSSIDPSVTVLGAPGLLTRRTQTQVSVTGGNTIVIAGLLQSESGKDIDALPGIGKLPILGKLFRSDNLRNNVSELVIFITPEIVDPSQSRLSRRDQDTHEFSANRLQLETEKLRKVWVK